MSVADRLAALAPEQRALFDALAGKLREKQREATLLKPPPVRRLAPSTGEGDWPLSLDQERFWFMEQLDPDRAAFNIDAASRLCGALDLPALRAAFADAVARHAAWRTTFPVVDGRPVARVAARGGLDLALIDLAVLPADRREAEAMRWTAAGGRAPFDLARGPLLRALLLRLGEREHVCLLTVHHLVTDGVSFEIFWGELAVLYALHQARRAGAPPPLPPPQRPAVEYSDFARWQRDWLRGEVLDGLLAWWREQLAGFPLTLDLPTDRPLPAAPRGRGGRSQVRCGRALAGGLRALARREGATVFMAVLAAAVALVGRLSGQERLVLGANHANRNRPELEPVVSPRSRSRSTLPAIRRSASSSGAAAPPRSAPSRTATSPSAGWSRRCSRRGTRAARRSSRRSSRCSTRRQERAASPASRSSRSRSTTASRATT